MSHFFHHPLEPIRTPGEPRSRFKFSSSSFSHNTDLDILADASKYEFFLPLPGYLIFQKFFLPPPVIYMDRHMDNIIKPG